MAADSINLHLEGETEADLAAFFAALRVENSLRYVSLVGTRVGDAVIEKLAQSPALASVQILAVERCGLTDKGVRMLAGSPHLGNLRELYLCNRIGTTTGISNEISDAGAIALASSPHLGNLRDLDLWNTGVGDAGFEAIIASPHLVRLRSLTTWATRLTAEGAQHIKAMVDAQSEQRAKVIGSHDVIYSGAIHTDYDERVVSWDGDGYEY